MGKEFYKETKFRMESLELIGRCNEIVSDFVRQNLRLTLRQLYYQLVTRNIIRNEERAYKNLSNLMSDAHLAGLIDWEAIEDRIRVPVIPDEWNDIAELVEEALILTGFQGGKDSPTMSNYGSKRTPSPESYALLPVSSTSH